MLSRFDDRRIAGSIAAAVEGRLHEEGYRPVVVQTERGPVEVRHYRASGAAGVVWLGGVGGGWDTPAEGLYPRLGQALLDEGLSSARVRFRQPTVLDDALFDALVGARLLAASGCQRLGFVGHSLGGAVAIQAAARTPSARTVITLASQSYGASPVAAFERDTSILVLHGTADQVLPVGCSRHIRGLAGGPAHLVLIDGAGHALDEAAEEVTRLVRAWLVDQLACSSA